MKKIFSIFIILALSCFFIWQEVYLAKDYTSIENEVFLVEKGQNLFQIAEDLEKEGLIKSKFWFDSYVLVKGTQGKLQAGEYFLNPSMSIAKISKKIISGEVIKEVLIIPEGWNLRDIGWYLENKGICQAEELFELVGFPAIDYSKTLDLPKPKDFSQKYDFLKDKPEKVGLEGYLFPDTYEIDRGEGVEEIVQKMLDNFQQKIVVNLGGEIVSQKKSLWQVLIMASLLEREVRTVEDKKIVAGILWKRLSSKMPLQVDATITYITGKKTTKISIEETKIDSSYNTYKYQGLPLGPICNPGLESILAALYPESSEYWYYLSLPEGKTIFSKTLKDHNIAKQNI